MKHDAIVIGAGLYGATIARALRQSRSMDVLIIDDRRPLSGSVPSGSLMKPGWFSRMGEEVYRPSLATLGKLYDMRTVPFRVWPSRKIADVHWVPTAEILNIEALGAKVDHIRYQNGDIRVVLSSGEDHSTPLLVVAAGFWTPQLVSLAGMEGKQGVSFRFPAQNLPPAIRPWAPYKQVVCFQEGENHAWGGDGTALQPKSWSADRLRECTSRVSRASQLPVRPEEGVVGLRPYVKGYRHGYLEQRQAGMWIATGGAKNGLISAGWAAHQIALSAGIML